MKFTATKISGAYLIEPERFTDERGFFARTWCEQEFRDQGLTPRVVQCSISFSPRRGTLRGMHYQAPPNAEDKLVRCTRGAIFDVIVDLRADSPTFRAWTGYELSAENRARLVHSQGVGARLSDLGGRLRSLLPNVGILRRAERAWRAVERSGVRHRVAGRGDDDRRARRELPVVGSVTIA